MDGRNFDADRNVLRQARRAPDSALAESRLPEGFVQVYADALSAQLAAPGEAGLLRAFELGGDAQKAGASVLDLTLAHHLALGQLGPDLSAQGAKEWLGRAAGFLAEALLPFDMTLSEGRETNDKLLAASIELAEAHLKVVAESQERRRAEEALWQAQKHQAVGRLAGGVAHHFNNLLTAILGNLELVRRGREHETALVQKLDRASEAARRAVKLTRQLLTFSGRQTLRPDAFDPSQGLVDLIALFSGSLRGEVEVVTEIPAGLWAVRVDASELELALLNLAINAGDAMGGRGRLRIAASNHVIAEERLGLKGEYLMIEVTDDGPGIPADILPRVFDPFFTTKEVGVGTGLGLSQVLGFAHQSKGAVEVESPPGCGATVRIFLPAARGPGHEAEPARVTAGVILVVEDDADVAEIAGSMLQSHGFEIVHAYRGKMALDLLARGAMVDLVFAEMGQGGGQDGLDLARALRREFPGLPILLTTQSREAALEAEGLGVPVIDKPYRAGELYSRISALLASRG